MAIITGTPTRHASEDRLDRITAIAMTIGFGRIIKERQRDGKWYQITDTGVLVGSHTKTGCGHLRRGNNSRHSAIQDESKQKKVSRNLRIVKKRG